MMLNVLKRSMEKNKYYLKRREEEKKRPKSKVEKVEIMCKDFAHTHTN